MHARNAFFVVALLTGALAQPVHREGDVVHAARAPQASNEVTTTNDAPSEVASSAAKVKRQDQGSDETLPPAIDPQPPQPRGNSRRVKRSPPATGKQQSTSDGNAAKRQIEGPEIISDSPSNQDEQSGDSLRVKRSPPATGKQQSTSDGDAAKRQAQSAESNGGDGEPLQNSNDGLGIGKRQDEPAQQSQGDESGQ